MSHLPPELKKQLEEQKKQCIFCKLIKKEIPGKIVFEDSKTMALLDIYPAVKGHTLFLLKEHYPLMPYIPPEEFRHYFGLLPQLCSAVKSGMVCTAMNIFIASGGAAGQQSPHFVVHLLPRDNGDGFFNFLFSKRKEVLKAEEKEGMVRNLPAMMEHHLKSNPAEWHKGKGERPKWISELVGSGTVAYEDEKILFLIPEKGMVQGQIEIYSKEEEKYLEKLSEESSVHLFSAASLAAGLLFELFKAQGTNIIVKSGNSDDNLSGRLAVFVVARKTDDGMNDLLWIPKQPKYKLEGVMEKIKDKTWKVKYKGDEFSTADGKKEMKEATAVKEIIAVKEIVVEDEPEDEIRRAVRKFNR